MKNFYSSLLVTFVVVVSVAAFLASQFLTRPTPETTKPRLPAVAPGASLSAAEIFQRVSPGVAFITTPTKGGSGFLIEGNYVATNAHVVWPYEEVSIVFPNGSTHPNTPVRDWDLMSDLAVLGPIETDIEPLDPVDGDGLPVGSQVYLIGYPAEVEAMPQPTITSGILSRLRHWEPAGITYFQTDAATTSGQSGGPWCPAAVL